MDLCVLFVWYILGAATAWGGAAGVLEGALVVTGQRLFGGPFHCVCGGFFGASTIIKLLKGKNILLWI